MEALTLAKKKISQDYKKVSYKVEDEKASKVRLDAEGVNRAESRKNLLFLSLSYIAALGAFIYWLA